MAVEGVDSGAATVAAADSGFDYAGAASFGSGLIGGIGDMFIGPVMANVQKGWSSRSARHARQWAEYMRSTQYQTAVEDLRKAGLNPALAYTQGGAGTPGNIQAQVPDVSSEAGLARGASSGLQMRNMLQEYRGLKAAADERESSARSAKARADRAADYVEAEIESIRSGAERSVASADEAKQNISLLKQTRKIREADEASAAAIEKLRESKPGEYLLILREILRDVGAR